MLDRDAGSFRLGPAGICVPAARRYLPGTMVLETSWGTGAGWIIVRDALLIGGWHHEDERSGTHRRAPTDYDADHVLLRTIRCVNGEVEIVMDCEPVFDYGRKQAHWEYAGPGYHDGVATAERLASRLRLRTDLRIGFEGPRATARHRMKEGEQIYAALSWSEHAPPQDFEEAYARLVWTAHHWQHWVDRGTFPDHPWRTHLQRSALTLKGLTYAPTGALIAAAHDLAARDAAGRAQLGLPLQLDPRLDVHAVGALHARLRLGGQRLLLLHRRRRRRRRRPAGDVRPRRRAHPRGADARAPQRLRGRPAGADRQRRLPPGPARRLGRAARLRVPAHALARLARRARVADPQRQVEVAIENWRKPDRGIWEVRGEPKHFTSSKMFCWVACDRGARLAEIREDWSWPSAGRTPPTRSTPTSASTASTSAACSSSTTRPIRWTRRCC